MALPLFIPIVMFFLGVASVATAQSSAGECTKNAAYNQLEATGVVGPYAEFNVALKTFGLRSFLKDRAVGKALIVPSNAEMARIFKDARIDVWHGYNKPGFPLDVTVRQTKELKAAVLKTIVEREQFRNHAYGAAVGCRFLAGTHALDRGLESMFLVGMGREQGVPGTRYEDKVNVTSTNTTAAAAGRRSLLQTDGSTASSVNLGCGYNMYTGLPLTTSQSGIDPGILYLPIFAISTGQYTMGQTSSCVSSSNTLQSYSSSSFQQSQADSIGITAAYEKDSFTANSQWSNSRSSSSTNTAFTAAGGTQIGTTTYQMTPMTTQSLSADFIASITPIYNAVNYGTNSASLQTYLASYLNNYGTHYIAFAVAGAMANVVLEQSATTAASQSQQGVSLTQNVDAVYGVASGSISASETNSQTQTLMSSTTSNSRGTQLVPSNVAVPFLSGGAIDCATWTQNLEAQTAGNQQWGTIMTSESLQPILNVFAYPQLNWPAAWNATGLTAVQSTLTTFYTNCGSGAVPGLPSGCVGISTACNQGSFFNTATGCINCYLSNPYSAAGSSGGCSMSGTGTCDPGSGACYCANSGWTGTTCGQENPGSCWAQYSVSKGSKCIQNGFCNYGYNGNVGDCDGDVFGCHCICQSSSNGQTYGASWSSCNRGGGPNGDCPNNGQSCGCPSSC